ncbi:protein PAT1 homolog 1 [Trichogramma pretiosum]|uniref:protein PAT1 homolog 1 n=1 Tax=Trichogramma pretiosum TaxID=7493 RepID=UPI0006C9DDEC|nr:protein PAT1 homolog 1 [Trichogramma pretiosum]
MDHDSELIREQPMADFFFEFDTSLGAGVDDQSDCFLDDEDLGEDYDALNDETFGSEATGGDWEQAHEKLAQITESNRTKNKKGPKKSEPEIDVASTLSHLVLDEREVTIPKPGVWDSPHFALAPPQIQKPLAALKNACTVEELERDLITNRPPPGLTKPISSQSQTQQAPASGANLFLGSLSSMNKYPPQTNGGVGSPINQFPSMNNAGLQNLAMPPPQFHQQNARHMPNQPGNMMRYPPMPPPHIMMNQGNQRPPHNNFPMNNFPHPPPNHRPGPMPFMGPDRMHMPLYHNNMIPHPMQHNMHMANQRNQNNHQPFFRDNRFPQQNQNRFFPNQSHPMLHMNHHMNNHHNMHNNVNQYGEYDEYAGLMNNREKQWLNNIQLLQLNTNQPYIDDYYYTVFCDRLNKKNEIKKLNMNNKKSSNGKSSNSSNNNNGFNRDSRDKEQNTTFTKNPNTPMQFENSLGKLQYSSVTAPRKIIDMDVVPNSDPQSALSIQQKDTKKTRQLLLEIERLYMMVLKLEDKSNPLAIIAEQQREQQMRERAQLQALETGKPVPPPEHRDILKEKEELIVQILESLLRLVQDDKFSSFLCIRKGKTLFLRFLACVDVKEQELKLVKLWGAVIKGLAIIGRRDSNLLINLYPEFHKWVDENCISFAMLMNLAKEFIESSSQTASKTNSLAFAFTNKLGISMLSLMIKHAEELSSYEASIPGIFTDLWSRFLKCISQNIPASPTVTPCESIDVELLKTHLRRHGAEKYLDSFELHFSDSNAAR